MLTRIFLSWVLLVSTGAFAQKPLQKPLIASKTDNDRLKERKVIQPSYDFSHVHICLDKISTKSLPVRPPLKGPVVIPKLKPNGELETIGTVTQGLVVVKEKMWSPGDIITVGFFPGQTTPVIISKVKIYAKVWESFANIKFQFVDDVKDAQVKVGFMPDNTSWSMVGRDVLTNTTGSQTVNFGWFDNNTTEEEFRRVIVHEFGHVLGYIHEHQSPAAGIPWDKSKVYAYFGGSPNFWSKEKVDFNIFAAFDTTSTNFSAYDRLSIMHYFFPPELVTDHSMFTNNTNLSTTDMQFSRQIYPFPVVPSTATGVLLTGDDCDEIAFSVEYNVVDKNVIEFILQPGRDPATNNIINWWKKISVPLLGNAEVGLEMQDGFSSTKQVAVVTIDKSRGIGFGKAKILGVHTGLNYSWKAWPAIIGGCRVRLTWRKDKC
ncbi:MAG: M12 family metallopeptidase [Flavisolibacter sp.]